MPMLLLLSALAGATSRPAATLQVAPPSVHAEHARQFGSTGPRAVFASPRLPALPTPTAGPDLTVYGYLAYWNDDLGTVPWDELTHIAIFNAEVNSDGSLSYTSRWDQTADAVAIAQSYGVKVHLCVTNFDSTELDLLLNSSTARNNLVSQLSGWVASTGADGVNIDFEQMPSSGRTGLVTLTADLEAAVGEVVLATPSVDWSSAFDYAALTDHADLFIMGYGYHWSGSSWAGPTDPLYAGSGTIWSGLNSFSLSWSLDDYLAEGADPDRVILGLPLYGRAYAAGSSAIPSASLGDGGAVVFSEAWAIEAQQGATYEADSHALMAYDAGEQVWFGDAATVADRIAYARDVAGVGGVGFWALNYEGGDTNFWEAVRAETTWSSTGTTTPSTLDTAPLDTATTDTGSGATTPPIDSGTPGSTDPTIDTDEPTTTSPSSSSPDGLTRPEVGGESPPEPKKGCGCASAPTSGAWAWLLVALGIVGRRR